MIENRSRSLINNSIQDIVEIQQPVNLEGKSWLAVEKWLLFVCLLVKFAIPFMSRGNRWQRVNMRYSVQTMARSPPLKTFLIPPIGSWRFVHPCIIDFVLDSRCVFSWLSLFHYYLHCPWVYSPVIRLYLTPPSTNRNSQSKMATYKYDLTVCQGHIMTNPI